MPGAPQQEPLLSAAAEPSGSQVGAIRGLRSVASDFATIAGGRLASVLLSFATVLITTRMLAPAAYGTVATALIVANLIYTVSTVWTQPAIRRYGREDLELRGTMSRLTWNRSLIAAPLAALAVAVVIALKAAGALPAELSWPLVGLTVGNGLCLIVVDHWQSLLETAGRMKLSAIGQLLRQLTYMVALAVFFLASRHRSPELLMTLSFAVALGLVVGWLPAIWRWGLRPVELDLTLLRRMLWLTIPVIGLTLSQYVIGSVDIIVLRSFTTPAAVGVYAVAYQAYNVLQAVAMAAPAVFLPLFVSLKMAGRRDLIERYLDSAVPQLAFLLCATVGIGVPLLPLLVPIVFGHAFAAAAQPLSLLCIALILLFGAFLMTPILVLHEQTRKTALINVVGAAINVTGDLLTVGVLHMGIAGPALATSAAIAFVFLANYALARRLLGVVSRLDGLLSAPLVAGLAPSLALPQPEGTAIGLAATLCTSAALVAWRCPFSAEDAQLVEKLDMPRPLKRALQTGISAMARASAASAP